MGRRRGLSFRRRRRWSRPGVVAGISVLAVLVLLLGAWAVDTGMHGDDVRRNVEVAGRDVGGQSPDELDATLDDVATAYAATPVTIVTPAGELTTTAAAVGLTVDRVTTANAVLRVDDGSVVTAPARWLGSLFGDEQVPLAFTVDRALLDEAVAGLVAQNAVAPAEPTLTLTDGSLTVVPGVVGKALTVDALDRRLAEAAAAAQLGEVRVEVPVTEQAPAHPDAEAQALAAEANALTDEPLTLSVGDKQVVVPSDTMRPWVTMAEGDDGVLALQLDEPTVLTDVTALIGEVGTPVTQLSWSVGGDGAVSFTEGAPGTRCCAPDTAQRVIEALRAGETTATIELESVGPDHDAAWAESMQIREQIASFTTPHPCCANRVTNIHLMADMVRGVVIPPDGTFSINEHVGKRTTAKGFLEDGVIYNGKMTKDVGGGVSQFATTLFNAAFFGGLDIPEYQMHTQYISRYPYGREATLSYPSPDLKIHNNTPYGVLIWPSYTGTSITVTLYSTPWVKGEQTDQTKTPAGVCTRVRTERTRTWLEDGRTETDTFGTLYQPADGVTC